MTLDIIEISGGWWRYIVAKEVASGEDATLSDLQMRWFTTIGGLPSVNYNYGLEPGTVDVPQITSAIPTDRTRYQC
ncbi:MAG: hypothetical protein R2764_01950 [Bacteroidales bacterium]